MAVLRDTNWLGQQRVDLPQLRALESAVRGDFDLLAGTVMAGRNALIVKGFSLANIGVGSRASLIQCVVAGSVLINFNATESGSIFSVPSDRLPEVLSATNPRVIGTFTSNASNFVGIDLRRAPDDSTSDTLQFLNASTLAESPRIVPLARTLDYRLVISLSDFTSQPNLVPIAIVVTDTGNNISSVTDARTMLFRLAAGADSPDIQGSFPWAGTRYENIVGDVFAGGDKGIGSEKEWNDAVMTRLWELGGGEYWYSATADRNVTMVWVAPPFSNGENFEWDGSNLHWKGLKFLFDNSTGVNNTVTDQTSDSAGLTDLADGDVLYVDLDRRSNATVTAAKHAASTLGPGSVPGARQVIAWRTGSDVFTRNWRYPVGAVANFIATTSAQGMLKISRDYLGNDVAGLSGANNPVAISDRGGIIVTPTGTDEPGLDVTGDQTGAGVVGTGGATNGPGIIGDGGGTNGQGVLGIGHGTGGGVVGQNTGTGNGVEGTGGNSGGHGGVFSGTAGDTDGVHGTAHGDGAGGVFTAGAGDGDGVQATGSGAGVGIRGNGGAGGTGVEGNGGTNGAGVTGSGGATSGSGGEFTGVGATAVGVIGTGGTDGDGVQGVGTADGNGVSGQAGASATAGVVGLGNSTAAGVLGAAKNGVVGVSNVATGVGVTGTGNTTGDGVQGTGGASSGVGVHGIGGATNGHGVSGAGTGAGTGVRGAGGGTDGIGVVGIGGGSGAGVTGTGGGSGGSGVEGTAAASNFNGGLFVGHGTGAGAKGTGGASSAHGLHGVGGATNGQGVLGEGTGGGSGVVGNGGATGVGVTATSGGGGSGGGATRGAIHITPQSAPPGSASEGDLYYDGSAHILYCYDGTTWQACF